MTTHEKKIIEKIGMLLDLLEENYKDSSDEYLIAPDQLEVLDVFAKVKKGNLPEKKDLIRMNIIWKQNRIIKKRGGVKKYKESIWKRVDDLIEAEKIFAAIKFVRENILDKNGEMLSLPEAKLLVEDRKANL